MRYAVWVLCALAFLFAFVQGASSGVFFRNSRLATSLVAPSPHPSSPPQANVTTCSAIADCEKCSKQAECLWCEFGDLKYHSKCARLNFLISFRSCPHPSDVQISKPLWIPSARIATGVVEIHAVAACFHQLRGTCSFLTFRNVFKIIALDQ